MFKLFTGDKQQIQQKIQTIAKEYKVDIQYSTNIVADLTRQYGLFYKPRLIYFLFDAKLFSAKEDVVAFKELVTKSKVPIICIIEQELDKRGSFYKTFNKQIEYAGSITQELDAVKMFYKDISIITTIKPNESISFLYKIFYDFKHKQYKDIAGECINLVLTGKVTTNLILKVFLNKILDKKLNM